MYELTRWEFRRKENSFHSNIFGCPVRNPMGKMIYKKESFIKVIVECPMRIPRINKSQFGNKGRSTRT